MDFFKKPVVAFIIALVVVCGSTGLNTQIMLGEEIQAVEDTFYITVLGEKSIYSRLEEKLAAANGLWTILVKYDSKAADDLAQGRQELIQSCQDKDIGGMKSDNSELTTAFTDSLTVLNGYELSQSELEDVAHYSESFAGAQKMIERSSYNTRVLEFMRSTYDKFPANFLVDFADVKAPVPFY